MRFILGRRAELQGAARIAVKVGVPIEDLSSLAALLAPEVVEQVLEAITGAAGTGSIGDGKVFVFDLEHAVRIRTGETGSNAL